MMVSRHDLVEIRSPKIDQNGYLVADAFPTKTGVFKYVKPDGSITRELRHPDDVFRPDSMESLKNRPIVDEHPDGGPMTAENTQRLSVGHVGEQIGKQDDHVKANLVVTDAAMIAKMQGKNGQKKNQLSCGYTADVIEESGTFKGQKYDHRQTNIVYNHLASVWKGRAGPTAAIHLDAEDAVSDAFDLSIREPEVIKDDPKSIKDEEAMTIKLKREAVSHGDYRQDAFEIKYDKESEDAVTALTSKLDAANRHIETPRRNPTGMRKTPKSTRARPIKRARNWRPKRKRETPSTRKNSTPWRTSGPT
ncbi:MAG: DUF2213 domain-containing protein [Gammaproteobacteria bacterium]|nr:DUF2213 domain-containing protein [Gammaproteobacteria bacterium]